MVKNTAVSAKREDNFHSFEFQRSLFRQAQTLEQLLLTFDFGNDTDILNTLNGILLMSQQLVQTTSKKNLSLDEIIQGNDQLQKLMNLAFNNSEDVLAFILYAPLKNPSKLAEVFMAEDPFGYLCEHDSKEIQEMFSIPSHADAGKVHSAICAANMTLLDELSSIGGYLKLQAEMENNGMTTNLSSNAASMINSLMTMLTNLPSSFQEPNYDAAALENTVFNFYQSIDLSGNDNNEELVGTFNSLVSSVYGNDAENITQMYFNMLQIYVNYLNTVLRKVRIEKGEIQLGSLFENTTAWKNVLQFTFGLQENAAEALLGSSIQTEKVRTLHFSGRGLRCVRIIQKHIILHFPLYQIQVVHLRFSLSVCWPCQNQRYRMSSVILARSPSTSCCTAPSAPLNCPRRYAASTGRCLWKNS